VTSQLRIPSLTPSQSPPPSDVVQYADAQLLLRKLSLARPTVAQRIEQREQIVEDGIPPGGFRNGLVQWLERDTPNVTFGVWPLAEGQPAASTWASVQPAAIGPPGGPRPRHGPRHALHLPRSVWSRLRIATIRPCSSRPSQAPSQNRSLLTQNVSMALIWPSEAVAMAASLCTISPATKGS
jgi:hypothetical protein